MVRSAAYFGMPYTEAAGAIVDRAGESAKSLFAAPNIINRKAEIVEALKLLSRRIVVFVDDLDRLEPREASEVLRLIRAVADFPNIIYILSYDVDIVSKTLQKAIQVDDGHAFLEKIVQVSFKVPRPEAFDLRRWLHEEVSNLFANEISKASNIELPAVRRLERVIDVNGGRYLTTPRDVVRALNLLRLHAIPVRAHIDVADMVWLQLVRIGNPTFYAWTEEYLTETSAIYRGAGVAGHVAIDTGERLNKMLTAEKLEIDHARFELSTILPGVMCDFHQNDNGRHRVFNSLTREVFNRFIVDRRLGSPEHYRYYFAFSQPSGALRDDQVEAFLSLAKQDKSATISFLRELGREARPQGGVMAELMIERLIAAVEKIPEIAIPNILSALSDILDDVALSTRDGDWGQHRSWGAAEHLVEKLLRSVTDPTVRRECLVQLFTEGNAIGWQTNLLRSEIFAHGHYGDRAVPETERLLTTDEFQKALAWMLERFSTMPPERLMNAPNLVSLLYGWEQGAGNDDARRWVEANTATNEDLLAFLSRARGWSSSSDGVRYPLNRRDLSRFLDDETAVHRVQAIADNPQFSQEQRCLARELLAAFSQGDRV